MIARDPWVSRENETDLVESLLMVLEEYNPSFREYSERPLVKSLKKPS